MHKEPSSLLRTFAVAFSVGEAARLASARVVPRRQQPRRRVGTRAAALPSCLRVPLSGGSGYCRGVVARTLRRRAARAGGVLKRPRLYDDVPDLCSRPWDDSRRPAAAGWARALVLGPRLLWHRRAWRHTKRTKQGPFGFSEAPAICAQPCATDQIAKRRAALLQRPKAAASNFALPCAGR